MNKERLLAVADIVEKGHHKFNGIDAVLMMGDWLEPNIGEDYIPIRSDLKDPTVQHCNTAACIAGFTCLIFDYKEASIHNYEYDVAKKAAELLELDREQSSYLFVGRTYNDITGPNAAKVIRHFVETGDVDWTIIEKD